MRPIICLVTAGSDHRTLPESIREAARAGVDLIQIREPALDAAELMRLTSRAVQDVKGTACRIVVNDRYDVEVAANAAGVHLRANSYSAARLRTIAPPGFLIGRSIHGLDEATAAAKEGGCDYFVFGTVFRSERKPSGHHLAGLQALREVAALVQTPVLAIGGISLENAGEAIAAGASGVAAIGLFRGPEPLAATVSALRRRIDT